MCESNRIGGFSHALNPGPVPQPRHASRPRTELATFWFAG